MTQRPAKTLARPVTPWFDRYAPWLVALVPLLLYLPALRLGFVYFDDDILLLINHEKIGNLIHKPPF